MSVETFNPSAGGVRMSPAAVAAQRQLTGGALALRLAVKQTALGFMYALDYVEAPEPRIRPTF